MALISMALSLSGVKFEEFPCILNRIIAKIPSRASSPGSTSDSSESSGIGSMCRSKISMSSESSQFFDARASPDDDTKSDVNTENLPLGHYKKFNAILEGLMDPPFINDCPPAYKNIKKPIPIRNTHSKVVYNGRDILNLGPNMRNSSWQHVDKPDNIFQMEKVAINSTYNNTARINDHPIPYPSRQCNYCSFNEILPNFQTKLSAMNTDKRELKI